MMKCQTAVVALLCCFVIAVVMECCFIVFYGRTLNKKPLPFFDSHTDMIHTLPFVVDYNMTMNRLNQMENPTQQPETSASYCTEIDLAENFRFDCSYFNFYAWKRIPYLEFDFVRTCCFNRTSHVLYMKQPTEFQVIKDNVYIDDPSLQIQPLVKSIIRRPIVRSFYIILNGNDDQLRKAASLLFNTDVSSLSAEEFVPYHQLLWLMTAILPFEKCRIFALPQVIITDREELLLPETIQFMNSILPFLNKLFPQHGIQFEFSHKHETMCSSNTGLLGFPLSFRVTQQSWLTVRTLRLELYRQMGIPFCYSPVKGIRVAFSASANARLLLLDSGNWETARKIFDVRDYDPASPMHQIGDLLAKTDVLVVAFDDLLFNMVLLRTNSVVVVIDNESEKHEAYHRAFATLGNELTLRYVVVKEKDLLEGRLTPFIQQFSEFIQGKNTDS
ncbi:hypothetical protein WA588_003813, partial [Blastocystis sp. NMH]